MNYNFTEFTKLTLYMLDESFFMNETREEFFENNLKYSRMMNFPDELAKPITEKLWEILNYKKKYQGNLIENNKREQIREKIYELLKEIWFSIDEYSKDKTENLINLFFGLPN